MYRYYFILFRTKNRFLLSGTRNKRDRLLMVQCYWVQFGDHYFSFLIHFHNKTTLTMGTIIRPIEKKDNQLRLIVFFLSLLCPWCIFCYVFSFLQSFLFAFFRVLHCFNTASSILLPPSFLFTPLSICGCFVPFCR